MHTQEKQSHTPVTPEMQIRWRADGIWNYGVIVGAPMPEVHDVINSWGLPVRVLTSNAEPWPYASHPLSGRTVLTTTETRFR